MNRLLKKALLCAMLLVIVAACAGAGSADYAKDETYFKGAYNNDHFYTYGHNML